MAKKMNLVTATAVATMLAGMTTAFASTGYVVNGHFYDAATVQSNTNVYNALVKDLQGVNPNTIILDFNGNPFNYNDFRQWYESNASNESVAAALTTYLGTSSHIVPIPAGTVTVDSNGNPTTTIFTEPGASLAIASVSAINATTVKVTFASAQTSAPAASDFDVEQNGQRIQVSNVTLSSDGTSATLTLNSALSSGTFTVNGVSASIDLTAPKLQSATYVGKTITLTFDKSLDSNSVPSYKDFSVTDISVSGSATPVSLAAYVQVSGNTVTLTSTSTLPTSDTLQIAYTAGSTPIESTVGVPVASFAPVTLTAAPVSAVSDLKAVAAAGATATVTWSNPTTGSQAASYNVLASINGGPYTAVKTNVSYDPTKDSSNPYSFTFTGVDGQSVSFEVQSVDTSSKVVATSTATPAITLDAQAPTLKSATVNGSQLVLTFSETLGSLTQSQLSSLGSSFTITGASANPSVSSVSISGSQVTLTLTKPVLSSDTNVTITYTAPASGGLADVAGNAVASFSNQAVTNGTTVNTATLTPTGNVGAHASTVNEEFNMTDAANNQVKLDTNDVISITETRPDGTTIRLTPDSNTTLWFNVQNPAGNYVFDVVSASGAKYEATLNWKGLSSASLKQVDDGSGTYTYELDDSSGTAITPNYLGFVGPDGTAADQSATAAISLSGSDAVLNTTKAANGNYVLLFQDAAHNWYEATLNNPGSVSAPSLKSATVQDTTKTLNLTFSDTLASGTLDPTAFTVLVNGTADPVTSASVAGGSKVVSLTLTNAINAGDTVTISYNAPSTKNITDVNGVAAASFTNQPVTITEVAPVLVSAAVDTTGNTITLTYDAGNPLDTTKGPQPAQYTVTVNGANDTVTGVKVNQNTVVLTLMGTVPKGATVTLAYKDKTDNGGSGGDVTDLNGNTAASIATTVINNNSAQ